MSQTIDLTLDGLSCGHCVKRVKESLEQRPDVEQADVSVTEAHVTGTASAEQLIETIKQAGYDASVSHPKAKPLAESSIPSEALTAVSEALPAATADDDDSQQLLLSGMSCASCVTRVQNALQSVPGVTQARVNLAERTALVVKAISCYYRKLAWNTASISPVRKLFAKVACVSAAPLCVRRWRMTIWLWQKVYWGTRLPSPGV